jgi:Cdc6-like AAA superfamily ATPase
MDEIKDKVLENYWLNLDLQAGDVFTPAAPIDAKDLFAGRQEQLRILIDAICQRGQHVIIYGERGVGKTSLANIHSQYLEAIGKRVIAPRINCDGSDNFPKLWRKVFAEIQLSRRVKKIGFTGDESVEVEDFSQTLGERITPNDVRVNLTQLAQGAVLVVILDEFDRIEDERVKAQFSDTIKALSDYSVPATLVLVGVADSITDLISHHESIERSLVQIPMPRMQRAEMEEILVKALGKLGMEMELEAKTKITTLSRGLPHYVHLVGLYSARQAISQERKLITPLDVSAAIDTSIANAQQSIRNMYYVSTLSRKAESIYASVLLSCALARADEFGYFAASDVRDPLSLIMQKTYTIPYFARQLHELTTKSRGEILQKQNTKHRPRFRFRNPLVQPFIIMQGFRDGRVPLPMH